MRIVVSNGKSQPEGHQNERWMETEVEKWVGKQLQYENEWDTNETRKEIGLYIVLNNEASE